MIIKNAFSPNMKALGCYLANVESLFAKIFLSEIFYRYQFTQKYFHRGAYFLGGAEDYGCPQKIFFLLSSRFLVFYNRNYTIVEKRPT